MRAGSIHSDMLQNFTIRLQQCHLLQTPVCMNVLWHGEMSPIAGTWHLHVEACQYPCTQECIRIPVTDVGAVCSATDCRLFRAGKGCFAQLTATR